MEQVKAMLNRAVAAIFTLTSLWAGMASAQGADLDDLMRQLAQPDQERWVRLERQILREWGQSGSAAVDYVFQQGQRALQSGNAEAAIAHFSAVIDHAPEFAEAWNGRATAYFLANRLGQSMADIEQVLIRNPQHFGALAGLGMILEQLDRPDEARRAYEASLSVHPHQQSVIDALARLDLASEGQSL
jgi:Flp pilus assembly protein TadD